MTSIQPARRYKSYVTSRTKNREQQSDIITSNGSFTAALDDSSVTTFVADVVSDTEEVSIVPHTFKLSQNYPNPFPVRGPSGNPTTVIGYQLPVTSSVSLKVYNLLGQEVATLFEGIREPGNYEAMFDGSRLAGGMYFYRMDARQTYGGQASNFMETKKLILMR